MYILLYYYLGIYYLMYFLRQLKIQLLLAKNFLATISVIEKKHFLLYIIYLILDRLLKYQSKDKMR